MADTRFFGGTAPVITITKWHDVEEHQMFYDLYLNGKVEGRYNFSELTKKLQEVVLDI